MSEKQLLAQLAALRESLRSADIEQSGSLSRVFHAFFDIAEGPDLVLASKPTKNPVVRATLERIARDHVEDQKASLQSIRMLGVPAAAFLHGGFFVAGAIGTFFYFTGDEQGLVAFNRGTDMTYFCRVTATTLPPGTGPMRGPRGKA